MTLTPDTSRDSGSPVPTPGADGTVLTADSGEPDGMVWAAAGGGGGELDYAEITSDVTISATGTPGTDVISLPARVYDGSTTVMIEFFTPRLTCGASNFSEVILELFDGSTLVTARIGNARSDGDGNADFWPTYCVRRLTPSAGSHTYNIKGWRSVSDGVVVARDGSNTQFSPAFMRAVRV